MVPTRWRWGVVRAVVVGASLSACTPVVVPPPPVVEVVPKQVDGVVVEKARRRLWLFADGQPIREYAVALGANPVGPKVREGDGRTPEGLYRIDWRNPESRYHRALHVSYPGLKDLDRAAQMNVPPGGDIMIHGLPNDQGYWGREHVRWDWTAGCIAVSNEEIEEIWSLVPDGTPIDIRP